MPYHRLACLIIFVFIVPIVAQDTLFSVTFEDSTLPDNLAIQNGTATIIDGQLDYTVENGGFLVIPEGTAWTDYRLETTLTINSGSVWLQARTGADLCSGYYLTFSPSDNLIDLSIADSDCDFTVLDATEMTNLSRSMTVSLEVNGEAIRGYIDSDLILEITDSTLSTGFPIINIFSDDEPAQVLFDSIHVLAIVEDNTAEPTIDTTPEATPELIEVDLPSINEIPLDENPDRVVETLVELGLIPTADGNLYTRESVVISRIGAWFEPLFDDVTSRHAVMSGDVFFLPNSDNETCLLSARIERDSSGVARRYLDIGINSLDEIFIGETDDNGVYSQATQAGLIAPEGGNLLFIAYGNRLSVYVNGRAVFQNIEITRRDGSFGVSANATTSFTLCHMTNVWLYTFVD